MEWQVRQNQMRQEEREPLRRQDTVAAARRQGRLALLHWLCDTEDIGLT